VVALKLLVSFLYIVLLAGLSAASAAAQTPAGVPDAPAEPVRMDWDPRPSIRVGDLLRLDFRLKLQGDLRRFSADQSTDDGTFEFHRRRVGIEGELFDQRAEFQIERETRDGGSWRDVYLNVRVADAFEVRAGKFKIPFGLEETTGTTDLDFVDRTLGSDILAPARSVGIMAHGEIGRLFEYEAGGFRKDGENARLTEPAFLLPGEAPSDTGGVIAARIVGTPWGRGGGSRPRFGLAATSGSTREGLNSLRGRTVSGYPFFPRVNVNGRRVRVGLEGEWNPGPLGFRGEYIRDAEERLRQGLGDVDLSTLIGHAWYLSATWVLTGESKAGGIRPGNSLFAGGMGAVEIGTRLETLAFGSVADQGPAFRNPRADHLLGNADRVWTTGVNWYVNRWVKLQGNAIREALDDAERTPVPGRRVFWSGVLRMQLVI
jgi:phosphate-selective porin OprO/OprP